MAKGTQVVAGVVATVAESGQVGAAVGAATVVAKEKLKNNLK